MLSPSTIIFPNQSGMCFFLSSSFYVSSSSSQTLSQLLRPKAISFPTLRCATIDITQHPPTSNSHQTRHARLVPSTTMPYSRPPIFPAHGSLYSLGMNTLCVYTSDALVLSWHSPTTTLYLSCYSQVGSTLFYSSAVSHLLLQGSLSPTLGYPAPFHSRLHCRYCGLLRKSNNTPFGSPPPLLVRASVST
jgi:hypothetical protein